MEVSIGFLYIWKEFCTRATLTISHTLKILPSAVIVWLDDTPSVLVTETEYVPKSSLSAFLKISLELGYRHRKMEEMMHSQDYKMLFSQYQTMHICKLGMKNNEMHAKIMTTAMGVTILEVMSYSLEKI